MQSFDFMIQSLQEKNLSTIEFNLKGAGEVVKICLSDFTIEEPSVTVQKYATDSKSLQKLPGNRLKYPNDCKLNGETYKGKASVTVDWYVNGMVQTQFQLELGEIPIMVCPSHYSC